MMISMITLLRQINENKAVVLKNDEIDALEIHVDDESDDDHNYRELFCFKMMNDIDLHLDRHVIFVIE